jgi:hypothetical protein
MIITKKALSRRTVLRGMGACLALPLLDAMTPALSAAATGRKAARMAFIYAPNGIVMESWTPAAAGAGYAMTPTLKAFEPFRQDMLVMTGLMDHNGNALGDGGGDHARAGASFLTGVHPAKTSGKDIKAGISVDQVAANAIGSATKLKSLELGCEDSRTIGNCDSGYSCAYTNSISWRGPATPNPAETNPRLVFDRLFGSDDITLPPEVRAKRLIDRRSILDSVQEQVRTILGTVGGADRRKMDEYLTAVREIETRIQAAEHAGVSEVKPDFEKPEGVPFEYAEYVKIMLDLAATAFQADVTRVATIVLGREGSLRTYNEIGVSDGHHPLSHHGNRPEALEKLARINSYHTQIVSQFIAKMKAMQDGDGSLLDHSLVLYGSGLSDSNRHLHENLPILLFGRGNGSVTSGRHIVYDKPTPMTNLYLTMLDQMGVNTDHLGDSTGTVEHLTIS